MVILTRASLLAVSIAISFSSIVLCLRKETEPYEWRDRYRYYTPSVETKMTEILQDGCSSAYKVMDEKSYSLPPTDDTVSVSVHPIDQVYLDYWGNFSRPSQMRVDPGLCKSVYTKKSPLFANPTCQLPGYMHQSAPRCQTSYLKWACEQASQEINDTIHRDFVLPDSDHAYVLRYMEPPPQPWLLMARNSLVSRCGQISTKCGLVHTNANCMSTSQKPNSASFKRSCPLMQIHGIHTKFVVAHGSSSSKENLSPLLNSTCARESLFGGNIEHYRRVFVVAEVDDTYVYHTHLGM